MDPNFVAPSGSPFVESVDGEQFPLEKARTMSKRMFIGGFFFLPLAWLCNVWLFWPDFWDSRGDEVIKKFTRRSAVCLVIATCVFLPWLILYAAAGDKVLSARVYKALDAAALDLSAYGLGIIDPSK